MSSAAATKNAKPVAAPAPGTLPPEEQFWTRYSPHGEAPISVAGSFAMHALGVGGVLLFIVYLNSLLFNPTRSLPVEPVRLDLSGGGGSPRGQGDAKGIGKPSENIDPKEAEQTPPGLEEEPRRPTLNPVERKKVEESFDADTARYIAESSSNSARDFARLNKALRDKLRVRDEGEGAAKGQGGTGSSGGKGTGDGKGVGSGKGPGRDKLSARERRMVRWDMNFTANTGRDYLQQLRDLGATLAFPIRESPPAFKVVHDLRPGAPLRDEDVYGLNRIYWRDYNQRSVEDILNALGARLDPMPKEFIAFMPQKLESQLAQMERGYFERVLGMRFNEDLIERTFFKVVPSPGGGYRPEIVNVKLKGK